MSVRQADVVVPVYRDVALTLACLESVLALSGDALGRLIVVDDCGPEPEMRPALRALRDRDARVRLLENPENAGFIGSVNRGMAVRSGDVVILNSDTTVTEGWLTEVLEVLHAHPRTGAVTPLSNNATLSSVPDFGRGFSIERLQAAKPVLDGLPRWTETPTGVGFCMALRGELLELVGQFDPAYGRGYNEENDWCQRIRALGFVVVRANRALVFHHGEVSFEGARAELDAHNARRLVARYPSYFEQNRDFEAGPHARVAAIGVASQVRPLRVCLDLAHVTAPAIHGTASYGVSLANALAKHGGLELSVRVHDRVRPALDGPLTPLRADAPLRGFDLVHKPSQVYDAKELGELLRADGHLVFTWQDLIALRSPSALGSFERHASFQSLTWAALSAAQGVLAISDVAADELRALMPALSERLARVHLGFDASRVPSAADGRATTARLGLEKPYVLHLGSDYPHKNLEWLLEAWRHVGLDGVELVLGGPPSKVWNTVYSRGDLPAGVRLLGELPPHDVLPVLRGARAVVLPSVYEGFGLSALEAMACEVPFVIAGNSALAEISGAAAHVPRDWSPSGLARAIGDVVNDEALRARLVKAGLQRVGAFDWAATARGTVNFYAQVARRPNEASLHARDALRRFIGV